MTPEGRVKEAVKSRLIHYNVLPFLKAADATGPVAGMFWMPVQGQFAIHGVHDFVGVWGGVFFSLETKAPNNPEDATEPQRAFHEAATKSGGVSFIGVRDSSAVDVLYQRIMEKLNVRT